MALPSFILPVWRGDAFVWPSELLQLLVVDGGGTRPSGTRTIHCGTSPIAANTIIPCLGATMSYDVDHMSSFASMYGAYCVSPAPGIAIDGGIVHRPFSAPTVSVDTPPFSFSGPPSSSHVPIGNMGLSIFPYTREPMQYAALRLKAVLRPAPRNWFTDANEQYAPFRLWLVENWMHFKIAVGMPVDATLAFDAFPLSVIQVIDDVPPLAEIFVLSNYFDYFGRRPEYHPPMPLLMLPRDVLAAFIDAVPGYTMLYLHTMMKHESVQDRAQAYMQAFSRVLQKERLSDIEAYTVFVSALTDVLRQWASDPTQAPAALPALPNAATVVAKSLPSTVLGRSVAQSVPFFSSSIPSMSPFTGIMSFPVSDTPFPPSFSGFTPCMLPPRDVGAEPPRKRHAFIDVATPRVTAVASTPCF